MIDDRTVPFAWWTPRSGQVYARRFAFRCGSTPPDPARHWLATAFVAGAAFDGERGCLVSRRQLAQFFAAHEGVPFILHAAAEGLEAIALAAPGLDIYRWVDRDLVEDPRILDRLLLLATEGHTDPGPRRATLEGCAAHHLGHALPAGRSDSRGESLADSYGRWLGRPFAEIEPAYLEALIREVVALRRLHRRLRARVRRHLADHASAAWGYVSTGWLDEQARRWGLSTHHIQLKASIVLRAITARGLHLDLGRRAELLEGLDAITAEQRSILHGLGYLPGQPSAARALQSILARIDRRTGGVMARTASGDYATSEEALAPIAATEPFVRAFLAYRAADQLRTAFLARMGRPVLHPSFDLLKTTGRTSSFGELNAQNLPRDGRVRSCIVARPGFLLVDADYRAIELVALAQACSAQFGLDSGLADVLNAGRDPHVMVAALATGKAEAEVTREERQRAKPVNFGLPGAMGPDGLQAYARAGYGVELGDDEVEALTGAWFGLFPEMREFLGDGTDLGLAVAEMFDLTPASYLEHTGSRRFHHRGGARDPEHEPSPILGGMFLKAIRSRDPATRAGRRYEALELDFFWSRARVAAERVPAGLHDAVMSRRPSPRLQRAVMALVDAAPVFTLTGRLRAEASFPARHNTIFQGLAADGAKLALWKVWRAGYAIVNFIHDELLVEVPDGPDAGRDAREIGRLMTEGMREVIPSVRVDVDYVLAASWGRTADARASHPAYPSGGAATSPHAARAAVSGADVQATIRGGLSS
jgi:hypothetical protein